MSNRNFFPSSGTFTNAMTFNSTVDVLGVVTISGATTVDNTLQVLGATTLSGTLSVLDAVTVSGATTIDNTLQVLGATSLSGTLSVLDTVTISGATTINNTLGTIGLATLSGGATIQGTLTIPTGAGNGLVLTSDADGIATWGSNAGLVAATTTTSTSETTLLEFESASGFTTMLTGKLIASQSGGTDITGGEYLASFVNISGNDLTLTAHTETVQASSSGTFSVIKSTISGSYINVTVTAPIAGNYNWRTSYVTLTQSVREI